MGASNKRVKRLVRAYTDEWLELLGVKSWFTVVHCWCDTGEGDDDGNSRTAADTVALWQYRYAKIRWYLPNLAAMTAERIEEVVVHELVHCLVSSMEQHVPDRYVEHREYAVETVTQALLSVRLRATSART